MKTTGAKIRELREAREMSQRVFAEHCSNHQSQVSKWERDESEPDFRSLLRISEIFRVPIRYLVDAECDRPEDAVEVSGLSDDEERILEMVRVLGAHRARARLLLIEAPEAPKPEPPKAEPAGPESAPTSDVAALVQRRVIPPKPQPADPDPDPDAKPGRSGKPRAK